MSTNCVGQTLDEINAEIAAARAAATPKLLAVIETATKRDYVIAAYADALNPFGFQPHWGIIRAAITEKWSKSAAVKCIIRGVILLQALTFAIGWRVNAHGRQ